jgi:hypothetical protein
MTAGHLTIGKNDGADLDKQISQRPAIYKFMNSSWLILEPD